MRLPTKRKAQRQRPDAGGHPRAAASPLRASSRSTVPDMPPSSPSQRRYTGTMASWISTPAARPSALATVFRRRAELSIRGSVTDTRSTKAPARRRRAVAARPCVSVAHVHCLLMASRRRQPRTPRTSSATALRVIPAQTGIQRRNDTGSPLPRGRHRICGERDPTLRRAARGGGHPASTRSVSFPRKREFSGLATGTGTRRSALTHPPGIAPSADPPAKAQQPYWRMMVARSSSSADGLGCAGAGAPRGTRVPMPCGPPSRPPRPRRPSPGAHA